MSASDPKQLFERSNKNIVDTLCVLHIPPVIRSIKKNVYRGAGYNERTK